MGALPLAVSSRGVDAGVVFTGAAIALVAAALLFLRVRSYMQQGHLEWHHTCQRCKYDLSGLTPQARCPECGHEVAGRKVIEPRQRNTMHMDTGRMLAFIPIAIAVVATGALRPVIWDLHHTMSIGRSISLAYNTSAVGTWVTIAMVVWAALYWAASIVRHRLLARSSAAAFAFVLTATLQIIAHTPSTLRLEHVIRNGPLVPLVVSMAVMGIATLGAIALDRRPAGTRTGLGTPEDAEPPAAPPTRPTLEPCTSSSPTTTASAPRASSPSTAPSPDPHPPTPSANSRPSHRRPSRAPPPTASPSPNP